MGVSVLALGFTACSDDDDGDIIPDTDASITAEDQTVEDNSLMVANVNVDDDGWIVVRRGSETGGIIADAVFLDDEQTPRTDVRVPLHVDANLEDQETVVIMLYEDNDDNSFDEATDFPFTDDMNNKVQATITVTVEENEPEENDPIEDNI